MLSRRAFLEQGSVALAAMALPTMGVAGTAHGPLGRPIGIQLYSVKEGSGALPAPT
jgi:hypothetical protein